MRYKKSPKGGVFSVLKKIFFVFTSDPTAKQEETARSPMRCVSKWDMLSYNFPSDGKRGLPYLNRAKPAAR